MPDPADHHVDKDAREAVARVADARLAWLLSLSSAQLDRLWWDERRALDSLGARAERIREAGGRSPQDDQASVRRLDALARRVPNLLTAGVYPSRAGGYEYAVMLLVPDPVPAHPGLAVRSVSGPVVMRRKEGPPLRLVTGRATATALGDLAAKGVLRAAELGRSWRAQLDWAVPNAQLDALTHGGAPMTGADVVVGIIDLAALDFYHADFRRANGTTRVAYLWDQEPGLVQAVPGAAALAPGVTYGVEYTAAQIDAELVQFNPPGSPAYTIVPHAPPRPPLSGVDGHGTAVTSCAAGNGRASLGQFRGAAPGADLIYVRLKRLDPEGVTVDHTQVFDAFEYIFARAAQLRTTQGQPKRGCVVSMSLGDLQGPHDGTTLGELHLDTLLAQPGRAVTVPAGNWNGNWRHARGQVAEGQTVDVPIEFGGGARSSDAVELWYEGGDVFEASFIAPDGTTLGPLMPWGSETKKVGNDVMATLSSQWGLFVNGDNRIAIIMIVPTGKKIPLGTWTLRLRGVTVKTGTFQAWLDRNNPYSNFPPPLRTEDDGTLGVPGSALGPITVGAHDKQAGAAEESGFSGRGPTRDGRQKPDLLAAGETMTVARAQNRNAAPAGSDYVGGRYGTSYATPLVAGACALFFECLGPTTTSDDLKRLLQQRAGPPKTGAAGILRVGTTCR